MVFSKVDVHLHKFRILSDRVQERDQLVRFQVVVLDIYLDYLEIFQVEGVFVQKTQTLDDRQGFFSILSQLDLQLRELNQYFVPDFD